MKALPCRLNMGWLDEFSFSRIPALNGFDRVSN
jgi:hypothetical protein